MKLAKNEANAKQDPEAELKLFESYSHFSSTLTSKNISKNNHKKQACLFSWDYTINHNENEDENEK